MYLYLDVFQWEANYELRPGMPTLISLFYSISVYVSPTPSLMADVILKPFFSYTHLCIQYENTNLLNRIAYLQFAYFSIIAPSHILVLIFHHVQFIYYIFMHHFEIKMNKNST